MKEIICGIYKITNKINNKCYIGQSIDVYTRWEQHRWSFEKKNRDYALYRAFEKYGIDNFEWEILEECSEEELSEKEINYICLFDSFGSGYNMTTGGDGCRDLGNKEIFQYDLNGNFVRSFKSMSDAARFVGANKTQLSFCCCNCEGGYSAFGYQWRYTKQEKIPVYTYTPANRISVDQYSLDGKYISTFESCTQVCKHLNPSLKNKLSKAQISDACKKDNHSAGGFLWRFHGDSPPPPYKGRYYREILQYSLDGAYIQKFFSLKDAAESAGTSKSNVCCALQGKYEQAGGYIWKDAN